MYKIILFFVIATMCATPLPATETPQAPKSSVEPKRRIFRRKNQEESIASTSVQNILIENHKFPKTIAEIVTDMLKSRWAIHARITNACPYDDEEFEGEIHPAGNIYFAVTTPKNIDIVDGDGRIVHSLNTGLQPLSLLTLPRGTLVSSSVDMSEVDIPEIESKTIRSSQFTLWNFQNKELLPSTLVTKSLIVAMAAISENRFVTLGASDKVPATLEVWNKYQTTPIKTIDTGTLSPAYNNITLLSTGNVALSHSRPPWKRDIHIWNLEKESCEHILSPDVITTSCVPLPDGLLAIPESAHGKIQIWSTITGKLLRHIDTSGDITPLPDGNIVISNNKNIAMYDKDFQHLYTMSEVRQTLSPLPHTVCMLQNNHLAFARDGQLNIWDLSKRERLQSWRLVKKGPKKYFCSKYIHSIKQLSNGKIVAANSEGTVYILDPALDILSPVSVKETGKKTMPTPPFETISDKSPLLQG